MSPERLDGWLTRFGERHGALTYAPTPGLVSVSAADGAEAEIEVSFPPLAVTTDPRTALVDHVQRPRRVGAVLVRKGGYAIGLFVGTELVSSKVGNAYVQGRTKAGGWSQHRFARRRANQAEQAYAAAADVTAAVLLPHLAGMQAVVGGGDKVAVRAVLADSRLSALQTLLIEPVLPTVDPRLRVLQAFPDQFRAVTIRLNDLA